MFPQALKVLVAGGFGAGKTTFVGAVSEIAPLSTEELLTQVGAGGAPPPPAAAPTTPTPPPPVRAKKPPPPPPRAKR
ncbi:ATP/GTP-binding protein, partial [Streptomyces sp. 8L]|nr:ATP/GTP-binding protein [Streptomyces sp. 8L]